ncbi:hypothetical protein MUP01_04730 [Candidatus Bathyarchaeota archaeon]|nr:hypothetical protein [Candidatus Bathyarchaeota archaeon]
MVYCTKTDAKDNSKVTYTDLGYATDVLYDTFLDSLIALACSIVDNYCCVPSGFFDAGGLAFSNQLYDYRYRWISLKYYPVLTLTKVEYNTQGYGLAASWSEIVSPDYIVKMDEGLLMLVNKSPAVEENSVRVSYTAGYSAVPSPIKHVAIQLCCNALHVILQRKISPIVRQDDLTLKVLSGDIFSRELRTVLGSYVRRNVVSA